MKKLLCFAMAAACLTTARAAISVTSTGSTVYAFVTTPVAAEFSTGVLNGDGSTYTTTNALDTDVNLKDASTITRTLPTSTTLPPSSFSGGFRHNNNTTGGGYFLQSRPTTDGTNAANLLRATLQNDSGSTISSLQIRYAFNLFSFNGLDELPGFRVYYSLTGTAGTWQLIPGLSDNTNAGTHTATVSIGSWANGATMYLLWADDNSGAGGTDASYTIDDFFVAPGGVTLPLTVSLVSPTNGAVFAAPANVTVSAVTGGTAPASSVTFYTNGVAYAVVTSSPYNAPLSNLTTGTYAIHAKATNATEIAFSATNTITVRPAAVSYTGGTIAEDFNSMGTAGTLTPIGWYVSAAPPINSLTVTPDDGSTAPSSAILGFNYGTIADSDRALGTAPTGAERNMAVRIQNNTSSNIVSFDIHFDGEVWRNYTNPVVTGVLSNLVSFDQGATWIPTELTFTQPFPSAEPASAINGNDPANRTADIHGTITPPTPIAPGGVIHIRWWDANEGGTDGGLGIDNFSFTASFGVFTPYVLITNPTNGQTFAAGSSITINATAAMANTVTNVTFFRDGGILITNDATAPFSGVYSNATVGTHTLTATAQDSAGNSVSTTNVITITVNPNVPPSITVTNPADTSFLIGANISNFVSAVDSDGTIARVDYYVDGVLAYTDATPAKFEYCDALRGTHVISAIAVDNLGATGSNGVTITITNPPGATVLLTNGLTWKYLDDTTDPGATWRQSAFNDSGWSNGVAEIGFGDSAQDRPERTVARRNIGTTTNITLYFRRVLSVGDLSAFNGIALKLMADDGAVVYFNDVEVYRTTNMPSGAITHTTLADALAPDDGAGYYWSTNLPTSALSAGNNIIAVEVHQDGIGSSDISFDLMLWGVTAGGPQLTIQQTDSTHALVSWPVSAGSATLQYKTDLSAAGWTDIPGPYPSSGGFFSTNIVTSGTTRFFTLRQ
jgi:hypothetical protein